MNVLLSDTIIKSNRTDISGNYDIYLNSREKLTNRHVGRVPYIHCNCLNNDYVRYSKRKRAAMIRRIMGKRR